ncbi:hypothetical protein SEA_PHRAPPUCCINO_193 [Mycobacterium phage Phrappuccino]|uniref:Uncharacterized protein n=1 Tax=Mycobacterium phage Phrappuccino TaxID=2591223 RepID=A0A514DE42_9CAUD|nr:hypothetical protein KHQ87_gp193 [Mycobacterium phage Phrappuccino]QDH91868.1 hypothetical protein SEA_PHRAPPUCCINO_193 [Mycobacterium phage Phrappuccino]QIQ63334.1 hypothetical protein SEA_SETTECANDELA_218 [Mycobacterium phage Settecandela]
MVIPDDLDLNDPNAVYDWLRAESDPGMHYESETERFYERLGRGGPPAP